MPTPLPRFRPPKYRLHKPTGQALIEVSGRRQYLGKYQSPESLRRYDELVAQLRDEYQQKLDRYRSESLAAQSADDAREAAQQTQKVVEGISVTEVIAAYWEHAQGYYDSRTAGNLKPLLRHLRQQHGLIRAAEFGPKRLKSLLQYLVEELDWSRQYVNMSLAQVKRVFRWAVSEELVPASTYQALSSVPGLRHGYTTAREAPPIRPVPLEDVERTLSVLPPVVADMARLQLLLGCRPSEICRMRPCDVDRSKDVWEYVPASHKTKWRGKDRVIFIGPRAQEILRPYLLREAQSYCFSPADSERRRLQARHAKRKTPLSYGNTPQSKGRSVKDHYTKDSFGLAVRRACRKAGVPLWSPYRLRHTRATEIRKKYGLEASQVILGHSRCDVTQVYADRDQRLAVEVQREVG